jgi:hypothetical protein
MVYVGWRDLGPRREGRVWKLHATTNRRELSRPPFCMIARLA